MNANSTVAFAMFGWIPLVAVAFMRLPPLRAMLFCYIVGWLFLPAARYGLAGLPDYTKAMAVPSVIFLAIVVFDGRRLQRFRPRLVDLPVVVFCLAPACSSLSNGLGWHDALAASLTRLLSWGVPYLTGRLYCSSPEGRDGLARAMLLGGLIYAPLCLWEIRMSPQLHATVYGYLQHGWEHVLRGGGYRPMVFMDHGLMVAMWMTATSLVGLALWISGTARRIWGLPLWFVVPLLFAVTVLCKSFGALVLLLAGMLALFGMRWFRLSLPLALMLCVPVAWIGARVSGDWSWKDMTALTRMLPKEKSGSLEYRITSEDLVIEKTMLQPVFGWGGWDRGVPPKRGGEQMATDSLWIISLGKNGFVGLTAMILVFAVPVIVLWRRCPPRLWDTQRGATVAWALALVLTCQAIDHLLNDMENPIYLLIAGALAGLPALRSAARTRQPAARAAPPAVPVVRTSPPRAPAR